MEINLNATLIWSNLMRHRDKLLALHINFMLCHSKLCDFVLNKQMLSLFKYNSKPYLNHNSENSLDDQQVYSATFILTKKILSIYCLCVGLHKLNYYFKKFLI